MMGWKLVFSIFFCALFLCLGVALVVERGECLQNPEQFVEPDPKPKPTKPKPAKPRKQSSEDSDPSSGSGAVSRSSSGRFTKDGQGIIKDKQTGLQWYVGPDSDMTWYQAQSWIQSLSVGGEGWRMPTRAELSGLNGSGETPSPKGNYNYHIDPIFNLRACCPWSVEVRDSSSAWYFYFNSGKEHCSSREFSTNARAFAVRSR